MSPRPQWHALHRSTAQVLPLAPHPGCRDGIKSLISRLLFMTRCSSPAEADGLVIISTA